MKPKSFWLNLCAKYTNRKQNEIENIAYISKDKYIIGFIYVYTQMTKTKKITIFFLSNIIFLYNYFLLGKLVK